MLQLKAKQFPLEAVAGSTRTNNGQTSAGLHHFASSPPSITQIKNIIVIILISYCCLLCIEMSIGHNENTLPMIIIAVIVLMIIIVVVILPASARDEIIILISPPPNDYHVQHECEV